MLPTAGVRALVAPAATAAALLVASAWLADPGVGYVVACLLATVVAGAAGWRWAPGALRAPLAVTVIMLVALTVSAGRAELRLAAFTRAPAQVGAQEAAVEQRALRARLDAELVRLRQASARGIHLARGTTAPDDAVSTLEGALGDLEHRAALVLRGDTLVVWAGTLHASPQALTGPSW